MRVISIEMLFESLGKAEGRSVSSESDIAQEVQISSPFLRASFPAIMGLWSGSPGGWHKGRGEGPSRRVEDEHSFSSAQIIGWSHVSSLFLSNMTHGLCWRPVKDNMDMGF